jgi:hypothetical protein
VGQVYISYSQSDQAAAKKIRDALQAWGHTVWFDDPDDEFDQSLAVQFDRGLRDSDVFLALLSPTSIKSRTVRREIALAKSLHKFIVPVLVEPLASISEDAKYIDATTDISGAISKIVKIVDTRSNAVSRRAAAPPPASSVEKTEVVAESVPAEEDRQINPIVLIGGIIGLVIIFGLILVAFIQSGGRPSGNDDVANAQATAAAAQATANALATALQQQTEQPTATATRIITATQAITTATDVPASATQITATVTNTTAAETDTPAATDTRAPTISPNATTTLQAILTRSAPQTQQAQTATAIARSVTATISVSPTRQASPTATPTQSGPTDEPSPTPEGGLSIPTQVGSLATSTPDFSSSVNLLVNPGFESFAAFNGNPPGEVAQGWTAWSITGGSAPSYQLQPAYRQTAPNSARIRGGINAQQISSDFATHIGGLYQSLSDITPGSSVRFSVYAYVWSSSFADPDVSEQDGDVTLQVGIDPTGGTDPQSANIVWSEPVKQYDEYNEYIVTTQAQSSTVTVFIRSAVDFPVQASTVYLDDANLAAAGG